MADITDSVWNEVDALNDSTGTLPGFPEGMNPSAVDDAARALMGAITRWYHRTNPTVTSTGSANAQALTYTVAPAAYTIGDVYRFNPGFTNSAATTVNVNSLGDVSVLCHGQALQGGEIVENVIAIVAYDSTNNFQLLNPQGRVFGDLNITGDLLVNGDSTIGGNEAVNGTFSVAGVANFASDVGVGGNETITGTLTVAGLSTFADVDIEGTLKVKGDPITILTGNVGYYISPTGDDSTGDGTLANPWATPMHVYSSIGSNVVFGTNFVTILMLPGTYTAASTFFAPEFGNWVITSSTNNAADVTVTVSGFQQDGVHVFGNATCIAQHFTVSASGGYVLTANGQGELFLNDVNVGAGVAHIVAFDGGYIEIQGNYGILGDANAHYSCEAATITASASAQPIVVTSSGTIAFTQFASCSGGGFIRAVSGDYSGVTATGLQYVITSNGVILTNGEAAATYFPPFDTSGTTATGGQWV